MLDAKETKTTHIRMSTSDTKCVTLMAIVTTLAGTCCLHTLFSKVSQMGACHHRNGVLNVPCCGKICVPGQGMDEGRKDAQVDQCCIVSLEGSTRFEQPMHAATHPEPRCIPWWLLIESSQWGLRWSTSPPGACTCASLLTLGLTSLSKLNCTTSGRNGLWMVRGLWMGRQWNHLVKWWPSGCRHLQ